VEENLVLDSGALSALAQKDEALRVTFREALKRGATIVVPTAVIAESLTGEGSRDARVNRFLGSTALAELDETLARRAAHLRHTLRARRAGTIDAIVVATADEFPGTVLLTTDPNDLRPLAAVRGTTRVVAL
jgi:predicted nucleic acid-binding protein